jgi:oligoribonuclease
VTEQKRKKPNQLVWIDLEMTGLEPKKCHIVEIAVIITDGDLKLIAEGPNLVIHQPPSVLKIMDEWSRKQHTKTGLLDEVVASKINVKEAERTAYHFIEQYCTPKVAPLCGNTVHHDRRFLIKYMPRIHEFLHYRHVDVSTIKDLIGRWYPTEKSYSKKQERHRALDDIRESIEELRYYRERYFRNELAQD